MQVDPALPVAIRLPLLIEHPAVPGETTAKERLPSVPPVDCRRTGVWYVIVDVVTVSWLCWAGVIERALSTKVIR